LILKDFELAAMFVAFTMTACHIKGAGISYLNYSAEMAV